MTAAVERKDITDATEAHERIEPTPRKLPIEANERAEPMERIEPTEPMDRIEPAELTDRIESVELIDQRDLRPVRSMSTSVARPGVSVLSGVRAPLRRSGRRCRPRPPRTSARRRW